MLSLLIPLDISRRALTIVAILGVSLAALQLPGPVITETTINFYQDGQWEVVQSLQISPSVQQALENGDESVAAYTRQVQKLKAASEESDANFAFSQQGRGDGWTVIVAGGSGQGLDKLNDLIFDGQADISVSAVEGSQVVSIFRTNLDPNLVTSAGGSDLLAISGQLILESNADVAELNNTSVSWSNPFEISVRLTELPASPFLSAGALIGMVLEPSAGGGDKQAGQQVQPARVNLIRNGEFEDPWQQQDGVAPGWEGFDNRHADFGWYEETWPEAVNDGDRAQLMEIFKVEANYLDRAMAIYQTVEVAPNSDYELTLYAMLRSDAAIDYRNRDEQEMHWGIDPFGEGNYDNVEEWVLMPLEEQNRLGSFAAHPEDIPLEYKLITGTIRTGPDTNRITLFIRGLKKFSTNVEVLYDVDDVSLVRVPSESTEIAAVQPQTTPATIPAEDDAKLPTSGAVLSRPASLGMATLGGLILVIIGAVGTAALLTYRK